MFVLARSEAQRVYRANHPRSKIDLLKTKQFREILQRPLRTIPPKAGKKLGIWCSGNPRLAAGLMSDMRIFAIC
jgi:hypothetical protein